VRALKPSTFGHPGISLVFRHFVRVSLPETGFSYEHVDLGSCMLPYLLLLTLYHGRSLRLGNNLLISVLTLDSLVKSGQQQSPSTHSQYQRLDFISSTGQEINLAIPNYRALQLSLLFGSGHRSRNSRPSRFKRHRGRADFDCSPVEGRRLMNDHLSREPSHQINCQNVKYVNGIKLNNA